MSSRLIYRDNRSAPAAFVLLDGRGRDPNNVQPDHHVGRLSWRIQGSILIGVNEAILAYEDAVPANCNYLVGVFHSDSLGCLVHYTALQEAVMLTDRQMRHDGLDILDTPQTET